MKLWQSLRLALLGTILVGVVVILCYSLLGQSVVSKPRNSSVALVSEVPLSGWKFIYSSSIKKSRKRDKNYFSRRHYNYRQQKLSLDIQMYYITNTLESGSNITSLIDNFTNISPMTVAAGITRQKPNIGFYTFFLTQIMLI